MAIKKDEEIFFCRRPVFMCVIVVVADANLLLKFHCVKDRVVEILSYIFSLLLFMSFLLAFVVVVTREFLLLIHSFGCLGLAYHEFFFVFYFLRQNVFSHLFSSSSSCLLVHARSS